MVRKRIESSQRTNKVYEMKLDLFRICCYCNKEFQITEYSEGATDIGIAFQDCPHCNSRNDLWLKIVKRPQEDE